MRAHPFRARSSTSIVVGTEETGEANYLDLRGRTMPAPIIPALGGEIRPLRAVVAPRAVQLHS